MVILQINEFLEGIKIIEATN